MFFARAGGGGSGSSGRSLILMLPAAVSGGVAGFVKRKTRSKIAGFLVGVAIFDLVFLFTKPAIPPDTAAGSIKIKDPPEEPDPPPPARAKKVKNSINMS